MQLIKPTLKHFERMAELIYSRRLLHEWAGTTVGYPFTADTLMSDFKVPERLSFSLVDSQQRFVAFGQCYERLGRCHLGRLFVDPVFRGKTYEGKRVIAHLIDGISVEGCAAYKSDLCSLFVLKNNQAAIKAYHNIGFELSDYPLGTPFASCLYMTRLFEHGS